MPAAEAGGPTGLWLTPGYPWSGDPGRNVYYRTQAQALARAGAVLTVAAPVPWAPWPLPILRRSWARYAAIPRSAREETLQVIWPRYLNVPGEPAWARAEDRIAGSVLRQRKAWRGATFVHGHGAITSIAAGLVARRARLPLVLTFHGSDLNTWPDHHPERIDALRRAVRQASAVITVSAALAGTLRSLADVEAIHLPLGSDLAGLRRTVMPQDEARARLGLPGSTPIALYLGNLLEAKGVRALVDAAAEIGPDWHFVIVGDGPERDYRADDPAVAAVVDFRGPVAHEEVPVYLAAADVLVLPSASEGLPSVLVEAGALGTPVVASAVGGIPSLLDDDRGILLHERSPSAIAAALREIRRDHGATIRRADALRALVDREYDVDRNASRLIEIYRGLATTGVARGGARPHRDEAR